VSGNAELHTTSSSAETEALASELASNLKAGDVVLLCGDLGAGKTTFVRGAARALGVSGPITSPTFTIGHIYESEGQITVSHLDLYRLKSMAAEDPDLLADYIGNDTIAFVEWPANAEHEIEELGTIAYRIELEHAGQDTRRVTVSS
jgi:tRNA threonylcarbamoyladenosine biosynthesis protein TsaE